MSASCGTPCAGRVPANPSSRPAAIHCRAAPRCTSEAAKAVNKVQTAGSDVNGNAGQALFNPPNTATGTALGAASSITVALTNGSQIAAAASGGASGDDSNLASMIGLQSQCITNGATPGDAFSNLTFSIGNTISQANSNSTATGNILTQLQNQQGSIEGVSIDEESSNLMLYQRSYYYCVIR